ncbi:MAG: 3-hydroxyacyl-ACP dehydratase [Candidatus Coatesbacteria bacterium]|nr:3-hydroxyacyl-ACP dehydratase [Candidatus Coatesbacteria bacterium]
MNDFFIGIDSGSRTLKIICILDNKIVQTDISENKPDIWNHLKKKLKDFPCGKYAITGYGRDLLSERLGCDKITEISAFTKGALFLYDNVRTIIDLGGQDTKIIRLNEQGKISSFALNDKCAAGTGRFLEFIANGLEMSLQEFINLSKKTEKSATINSTCAVFAESEIVSLISSGIPLSEISRGIHNAILLRLSYLLGKEKINKPVVFAGGGARNEILVKMLRKELNCEIMVPDEPQILGAIGAALSFREKNE